MKLWISLLLVCALTLGMLPAMAETAEASAPGEWMLEYYSSNGATVYLSEQGLSGGLLLREDGTAVFTLNGNSMDGAWWPLDGNLVFNDGTNSYWMFLEGDGLVIATGEQNMGFRRASEASAAVPEQAAAAQSPQSAGGKSGTGLISAVQGLLEQAQEAGASPESGSAGAEAEDTPRSPGKTGPVGDRTGPAAEESEGVPETAGGHGSSGMIAPGSSGSMGNTGNTSNTGTGGSSGSSAQTPSASPESVPSGTHTFADAAVEAAVREALGISGAVSYADLASLESLTITDAEVETLDDLRHCMNLLVLDISSCGITDLSPLSGLTQLRSLWLYDNEIRDLTPLESLTGLDTLSLAANNIVDISPLAKLTNLTFLMLWRNNIVDISALSGLVGLEFLDLEGNRISNVSPLAGLVNLESLCLYDNPLTDATALAGLPKLETLQVDDGVNLGSAGRSNTGNNSN